MNFDPMYDVVERKWSLSCDFINFYHLYLYQAEEDKEVEGPGSESEQEEAEEEEEELDETPEEVICNFNHFFFSRTWVIGYRKRLRKIDILIN